MYTIKAVSVQRSAITCSVPCRKWTRVSLRDAVLEILLILMSEQTSAVAGVLGVWKTLIFDVVQ